MRSMWVSRSFIGSSPSSEAAVAPRRSLASRPSGPSGWWRARAASARVALGLVAGGVDLGEPVEALRGGIGLGVVRQDALQPRLGRLDVPDLEIVGGDVRLVLGERFAALAHAEARPLRPRALREAVDQVAEVGERVGMRLLVAIAGARLGEVRHAEVVLDRGQLRAGRVHALEVAEG